MHKPYRRLLLFIYKRLKVIWVTLCVLFFLLCSYINWHNNLLNSHNQVLKIAKQQAINLDNFINDIVLDFNKPALNTRNVFICKDNFESHLQAIIRNHPLISGLAIRAQQKICSTLPNNLTFLINSTNSQAISGPLQITLFNRPIYVIQKKIGQDQIEFTVMALELERIVNIPQNDTLLIKLIDEKQGKMILNINHELNNSWLAKKLIQSPLAPVSATVKLTSLNEVGLTVSESPLFLINKILMQQFLLILDVLILSYFLYFFLRKIIKEHFSLHGTMKQAVKNEQFYPLYQPLFDAKTESYVGIEILLRWKDNYNKIIMPDFFIEEAEDTGLIVPITLQIVETSFKELQPLLLTHPKFHLSFNICALHFVDPQFFDLFDHLMKQYNIRPQQILFEITERDLLDQNNKIYIQKMQALRELGFSLAVDDYGTGHSSISYLHFFPFNYLKIDKLFIQAIGTKAITENLNDAIINLAKKMNLNIIAEGVETQEQFDYLLKNDVRFLQGWYFSKAIPLEKLIKILKGEKK